MAAALEPLLAFRERAAGAGRLDDALDLLVLDPAAGDGALLAEAADLIAGRLGRAAGVSPEALRPEVVRRCLRGMDVDPVAVRLAGRALGCRPGAGVVRRADALADGGGPFGAARFHAVIGNPPWGGWSTGLDRRSKEDYRRRFRLARRRLDPCMLFLERAPSWLEPGGRLGLILPDYFLVKNYPEARAHLLESFRVEEVARWGMCFPGVSLDACSVVARLERPAGRHAIRCLPRGPEGPEVAVEQAGLASAPGLVFNLELDGRARSLLDRLQREGTPLGEWLEAHEGIHSGNLRPLLFIPPGAAPSPEVSPGSLRPLVFGRGEVRPFRVAPSGWRVAYDPGLIARRPDGYANLGQERWLEPPKLLVRRTGDRVMAAIDRQGLAASNNLFTARPRPGCPVPLEYLEAFLNSSLATWLFRAYQPRAGRVFAELKLAHLNRLPVPRPAGRGVEEAAAAARRLERLAPHEGGRPWTEALKALDRVMARLAGLGPREASGIEAL